MKMEKIKPVPKYIVARIKKLDAKTHAKPSGLVRYYSYLTKNDGELVKVTVAVTPYTPGFSAPRSKSYTSIFSSEVASSFTAKVTSAPSGKFFKASAWRMPL